MTPGLGVIYVSSAASGQVLEFDAAARTVTRRFDVEDRPRGLALDLAANLLYVANVESGSVTVIDLDSGGAIATVPVESAPLTVALDIANGRAYVANSFSASVSVIDTAVNEVIETLPVAANPWDLTFGSDGTLYVASSGGSRLVVFPPGALAVTVPLDRY